MKYQALSAHQSLSPEPKPGNGSKISRTRRAFTLIELLVVISIIGVLAALTVGLTGVATRKSKESRVRTELTKLSTAIENYKANLGFYPPDNRGRPSSNPLFYELSGTVFQGNRFFIPGRQEGLTSAEVRSYFGVSGFSNAQRDKKDLKFTEEFKANEYQNIAPNVEILAVPVKGPANRMFKYNGTLVNPWLYVSSSPTNNPGRFDLWTETVISGKTIRFSNWEKDPVVLGR